MYQSYPTKYQRLVLLSSDYHVKYCIRNCIDKTKCIKVTLLDIKGLS